MSKENPTFEEVNTHIESSDIASLEKAAAKPAAASLTAGAIPGQVCAAYKVVKPILLLLLGTPFLPAKWKAAIKVFMSFMNAICP